MKTAYGFALPLATLLLGFSSRGSFASAEPVIAPPGGVTPSTFVAPNERLLPSNAVQHIVCFTFRVPTPDAPITLPALQTLDPTTGQPTSDSPQGSVTFTDLPSLLSAVQAAYYVEARQVPYLRRFGGGANMSHEGTSAAVPNGFGLGYDVCFSAVFANENDRDYFVGNDAFPLKTDQHHHAFRNFVGPAIAGNADASPPYGGNLLVFDYQEQL